MSPNTRAILLLTAPLQLGRASSEAELLSLGEYNELARSLHQQGLQPQDLLEGRGVPSERVERLLERGFLLGQAIDLWQSLGISVLTRAELPRLKARLKDATPPVLYVCGNVELLDRGGLAVLGEAPDVPLSESHLLGSAPGSAQLAVLEAGGTAALVLADGLSKAVLIRELRNPLREGRVVLLSPTDPNARAQHANSQLVYALADRALVLGLKPGEVRTAALRQLELGWIPLQAGPAAAALRAKGATSWP